MISSFTYSLVLNFSQLSSYDYIETQQVKIPGFLITYRPWQLFHLWLNISHWSVKSHFYNSIINCHFVASFFYSWKNFLTPSYKFAQQLFIVDTMTCISRNFSSLPEIWLITPNDKNGNYRIVVVWYQTLYSK